MLLPELPESKHEEHSAALPIPEADAEEEEENPLFNLPPMPELATPPQPIPEELLGPKSPLVIRKQAGL